MTTNELLTITFDLSLPEEVRSNADNVLALLSNGLAKLRLCRRCQQRYNSATATRYCYLIRGIQQGAPPAGADRQRRAAGQVRVHLG